MTEIPKGLERFSDRAAMLTAHENTLAARLADVELPHHIQAIIIERLTPPEQQTILLELERIGIQRTGRLTGWSVSSVRVLRLRAWAKIGQELTRQAMTSDQDC